MDIKQAYRILGVPEEAAREDIEKQYLVWVRRSKSDKSIDFHAINEAYNAIQSHWKQLDEDPSAKRKPWVEKLDHFFHYYKFHAVGAIALILVVIYFTHSYMEHRNEEERLAKLPPVDVSVTLYGDFYNPDTAKLEQSILQKHPEWKRVEVKVIYLPSDPRNPEGMALQQKAVLQLITEKSDLYIVDQTYFDSLAQQGLFQPLDASRSRLGGEQNQGNWVYAKTEDDADRHLYGVDLADPDILKGISHLKGDYIAGIRQSAAHGDNALKLLSDLSAGSVSTGS